MNGMKTKGVHALISRYYVYRNVGTQFLRLAFEKSIENSLKLENATLTEIQQEISKKNDLHPQT